MPNTLTVTQGTILAAIRALTAEIGHSPTLREIGERSGLSSASTVSHHIRTLTEYGHLHYTPNIPRSIRLTSRDSVPAVPTRTLTPPPPRRTAAAREIERENADLRARVDILEGQLAAQRASTKRARGEAVVLQQALDAFYAPDPQS